MRRDFDRQLTDFPTGADARTRLRFIWDIFLDWDSDSLKG